MAAPCQPGAAWLATSPLPCLLVRSCWARARRGWPRARWTQRRCGWAGWLAMRLLVVPSPKNATLRAAVPPLGPSRGLPLAAAPSLPCSSIPTCSPLAGTTRPTPPYLPHHHHHHHHHAPAPFRSWSARSRAPASPLSWLPPSWLWSRCSPSSPRHAPLALGGCGAGLPPEGWGTCQACMELLPASLPLLRLPRMQNARGNHTCQCAAALLKRVTRPRALRPAPAPRSPRPAWPRSRRAAPPSH